MSKSASLGLVEKQMKHLRAVLERWPRAKPTAADIAFTYITLCAAIEFCVREHVLVELDKIETQLELSRDVKLFKCLGRMDENGNAVLYDESVGRGRFQRLIGQERKRAERLTFGDFDEFLDMLGGEKASTHCMRIDSMLHGDLKGLFALRHHYAHGRPFVIDEEADSRHNMESPSFSLREVVKSLRRINVVGATGDFFNDAGMLYDVLYSTMAVTFYWRRAGEFISAYVDGVPYDRAYRRRVQEVRDAAPPLNIVGVSCL